MLDRFDCYELCVQSPRHVVTFLTTVHGGVPVVLHEDFSGTAAVSRRWALEARKRGDDGRAVAIDLDSETVEIARRKAAADDVADRVTIICGDVTDPAVAQAASGPDAVFVGNFSIGYLHTRSALLAYLRGVRARLERGNAGFGGGIFACDVYGGAGAFRLGGIERRHPGRGREVVRYTWVHERADPITGMVQNSISFRVEIDGEVVQELHRAFEYVWRLWSLPELREAVLEAGFKDLSVHAEINLAPGQPAIPVERPEEFGEDWIVLMVARA